MASYREEEDPFEEDIVFDQAGLLNSASKMNTAIRRVSSGKCVLFAKTLGLCGAFFGLGLCFAILGPTFPSPFHPLMELESTSSPVSNNIFVARTSGYVVGSIIGGYLFDRFNRLFLLFLSLLLTAIFITVTPWCRAMWILETCVIILAITMGFLDTGGNVLCLDLWGRNSGPFMQALHFSFGLGAFVAPLLAAPFLETSLVNGSLSTEFSHSVTDFPIHLEDPKSIPFHEGRFRREVDFTYKLPGADNEDVSKNVLTPSLNVSSNLNTSDITGSPTSFSANTDLNSDNYHSSTQSTSAKPRVPKRKPTKTDASKLGTKNWEKVHVGIPPPSDLLPLTTSTSSQVSLASTQSSPSVSTEPVSYVSVSPDPVSSTTFSSDSHISATEHGVKAEQAMSFTSTTSPPNSSPDASNLANNDSSAPVHTSTTALTSTPPLKLSSSVQPEVADDRTNFLTKDWSTSFNESMAPQKIYIPEDSIPENAKKIHDASSKLDDINGGLIFLRRYDNSSNMTPVPVLPSRENSERTEINTGRKSSLGNSLLLKSDYQNYSSSGVKISNMNSLVHDMPESSLSHLPIEKTVNISEVSEEDSVRTSTQKSNDENATLPKSGIASTLNPSLVTFKEERDDLHASTLEIGRTSSTLVPVFAHSHHVHHKPGTFDNDTEHINTIFDLFPNRVEKYGFNKIQFTYLIVGIFVFLISLVFLGFLCHNPRDPKSKQEGIGSRKITNKVVHKLLVALMAVFFFLYMGLEVAYGHLIPAFSAHSSIQLSVVFWGSFAAMRFASIFFASGFSALTMLLLNFAFCTCGTILVTFLGNHFDTALWVGTALIGIGLASMFPTGILWIERYIHVSNKVAAVFVIGVAMGELICPVTIYELMVMERMLFMYAALVINIVCVLTFTLLWWLASRHGEKYTVINSNGYQLANQHDEEEDMMDMSPSGSSIMQRQNSFTSEHRSLLNGNIHRGP